MYTKPVEIPNFRMEMPNWQRYNQPFLAITSIGFLKLKKRAKNTFFMITLIMSLSLIWYLSAFSWSNIIVVIFLLFFIIYFLNPSVKRLFRE